MDVEQRDAFLADEKKLTADLAEMQQRIAHVAGALAYVKQKLKEAEKVEEE